MSHRTFLYLSRADVAAVGLPMSEIIEAVEQMFVEKGEGRVEMPPKPGVHPRPNALIHAMPGYVPSQEAAGMKWVAAYPENPDRGLPQVSGLIVLNDPGTGLPLAVMDATWITAARTAAATAVAARWLARKESSTVGIVACGVQGRSNLEALTNVFDVRHVLAYNRTPAGAHRYAEEMEERLGVEVEVVDDVRSAVAGAELVVTSGPILSQPTPTIEAGWLASGAFACALDFDSYWQGAALRQADKLTTDDAPQMRYYREKMGYFRDTPEPFADLGEIVTGRKPGRERDDERVIAIHLGLALEDVVTAARVHRLAREKGIGRELPL